MTINLTPEGQKLVEKRLKSGVCGSAEEVIHRALESLEAEDDWLEQNRASIREKIERGLAQFEHGQGLTAEEARSRSEARKNACRDARSRG